MKRSSKRSRAVTDKNPLENLVEEFDFEEILENNTDVAEIVNEIQQIQISEPMLNIEIIQKIIKK